MSTVQSIDRAFILLRELARQPAGISDLARTVDLPTSTVARILGTLEERGAVERVDGGGFRIGPTILALSAGVDPAQNLVALAQPQLVALVGRVGEAAGISVATGYDMRYLTQVDGSNPVQVKDWTGERVPMHVASSGLVVLAHWPDEAVEQFLSTRLRRFTDRSVTDPNRIRRRLATVRESGTAWTIDEFLDGISSVAAPITDAAGTVVGALHCHGPSYRFPSIVGRHEASRFVADTARQISAFNAVASPRAVIDGQGVAAG